MDESSRPQNLILTEDNDAIFLLLIVIRAAI